MLAGPCAYPCALSLGLSWEEEAPEGPVASRKWPWACNLLTVTSVSSQRLRYFTGEGGCTQGRPCSPGSTRPPPGWDALNHSSGERAHWEQESQRHVPCWAATHCCRAVSDLPVLSGSVQIEWMMSRGSEGIGVFITLKIKLHT